MSDSVDDDMAASQLQQNLLKEAFTAAAQIAINLQSTFDGMDEALVATAQGEFERAKAAMLEDFARRIDAELLWAMKRHRQEQLQQKNLNALPQKTRSASAKSSTNSTRATATSWSKRNRYETPKKP
jgi:hypothetical protein